jgi:hypothetical protein
MKDAVLLPVCLAVSVAAGCATEGTWRLSSYGTSAGTHEVTDVLISPDAVYPLIVVLVVAGPLAPAAAFAGGVLFADAFVEEASFGGGRAVYSPGAILPELGYPDEMVSTSSLWLVQHSQGRAGSRGASSGPWIVFALGGVSGVWIEK